MAFFVTKLGTQQVGERWVAYANLTEDVYNTNLLRAETWFGATEPITPEIDTRWQEFGTEWEADLSRSRNPINYDKYNRRIERPCVIELSQIWRETVIIVRDNPGIGQGAFFALLSAEFPRTPYDLVNLFTWIITENTAGGTWVELRDLILANLGNFDTSTWPYEFINVERPF